MPTNKQLESMKLADLMAAAREWLALEEFLESQNTTLDRLVDAWRKREATK